MLTHLGQSWYYGDVYQISEKPSLYAVGNQPHKTVQPMRQWSNGEIEWCLEWSHTWALKFRKWGTLKENACSSFVLLNALLKTTTSRESQQHLNFYRKFISGTFILAWLSNQKPFTSWNSPIFEIWFVSERSRPWRCNSKCAQMWLLSGREDTAFEASHLRPNGLRHSTIGLGKSIWSADGIKTLTTAAW